MWLGGHLEGFLPKFGRPRGVFRVVAEPSKSTSKDQVSDFEIRLLASLRPATPTRGGLESPGQALSESAASTQLPRPWTEQWPAKVGYFYRDLNLDATKIHWQGRILTKCPNFYIFSIQGQKGREGVWPWQPGTSETLGGRISAPGGASAILRPVSEPPERGLSSGGLVFPLART